MPLTIPTMCFRNRIDRFGVVQLNIQKLERQGRILVELPGVKEPERVTKLLTGTANLEFWTTYQASEVWNYLDQANRTLATYWRPRCHCHRLTQNRNSGRRS